MLFLLSLLLAWPAASSAQPAGSPPPEACGLTLESAAARAKTRGGLPDSAWSWLGPAINYYQCAAYADRKPELCGELKAFKLAGAPAKESLPLDAECRLAYRDLVLARAIVAEKPKAAAACRKLYSAKACAIILGDEQPASACARLVPLLKKGQPDSLGFEAADCSFMLAKVRGSRDSCAQLTDYRKKSECLDFVLFREAYENREPGRCRGSRLCQWLMAPRPDCAQLRAAAETAYCRWDASASSPR